MARKANATVDSSAVLYVRVSSKEQEHEGFSIPAQQRLLREYAQTNRLNVVEEFVEAETAKRAGRKAFDRMLRKVKDAGIQHILVEKTDRLYRNFADYVKVDELGVQIHLVKESETLSPGSKSHEKLVHGLKVLLAKNYIDNLSEEIRKGLGEKAKAGFYPTHAPLGYLNALSPEGKKVLVLDPVRAPMIKQIFEAYALGQSSIDTCMKLCRQLGLTTKKGRKLTRASIHKTLRNPVYMGRYYWNGEVYFGKHEPLVTSDVFNRVQDILDGRKSRKGFGVAPIAYRGLIRCARCGGLLAGEIKKGKYVYYHCIGRRTGCDLPYVREECLTADFADFLHRLRIPQETLDEIKAMMIQMSEMELAQSTDRLVVIEREATKTRDKLASLYEDKLSGEISRETYNMLREKFEEQLADNEQRRALLTAAGNHWRETAERLFELCRSASDRFKQGDPDTRREILGLLLSNCTYDGHSLTIEPRDSFKSIMDANQVGAKSRSETAKSENWWR